MNVFRFIYKNAILLPFMQLYVQGPSLGGYGFYGGRDEAFICSSKTTMSQFFWEHHPGMCREIIERDAHSLIMTIACALYFYLLVHTFMLLKTLVDTKLHVYLYGQARRQLTFTACPEET
jgi:hypothetical protein